MSDSDTDLLPNNVLTFQSRGTTVSAKGPNINSTNISSLSFRNNVMTSTMNLPWNMDRPRYAESVYDQRSMYYRERETSPMSCHSASGMQPRNLHQSYYPSAMSSHRSVYNGRSGSPMSVRTIDSNTSMSAKDIAFAFQNGNFNKYDFKIIKDAYNRYMKNRTRKRVEKRRNIRMFLKGFRRRSGGDSGDQASNSSISSDDCRSIRTSKSTIYKENMSSCRSTKTDISDFRKTIRESNMVRDCSNSLRQNTIKSMFSGGPNRERESSLNLQQKWQSNSMANSTSHVEKDRFKSSFLLPSQRFNQSVAALPILEKPNRLQRINEDNLLDIRNKISNTFVRGNRKSLDTDSDQEEIFADVTVMEKTSNNNNVKRILEEDDLPVPNGKRTKLSPPKNNPKPKTPILTKPNAVAKQKSNYFVFAKPQLPVMKPKITKQQKPVSKFLKPITPPPPKEKPVKPTSEMISKSMELPVEKVITSSQKAVEKLISKSSQPLEPVSSEPVLSKEKDVGQKISQNNQREREQCLPTDVTLHSITDMSMRPSFIKRKLFTQKVDVAEKNSSSDSLQADSPQTNVYSKIQKEKNRARKLVTTQSCLSRDVADDSNLLDLIHKIVPADRMSVTTVANRTEIQTNKSKPANADKWDVTSIITSCNNSDNVSDTYTDEEIFAGEDGGNQQQNKIVKQKNKEKDSKADEQIKDKLLVIKNKVVHEEVQEKSAGKEKNNNINKEKPISTQCKPAKQQIQTSSRSSKCNVVLEKLQPHNFKQLSIVINEPHSPTERNGLIKATIHKGIKSFWDTDAESDLEATPLKRADPKNTVLSAKAAPKNFFTSVTKPANGKLLSNINSKDQTHTKTITNQKFNSSSTNKEKETNINNQLIRPTIISKTNKETDVENKTAKNVAAENKKVDKGFVKNKTKQVSSVENVNKVIKKTLPVSRKENNPPVEVSNEVTKEKRNTSVKQQKNGKLPQTNVKKTIFNKASSKNNNHDFTLSNNESQHITIHNNTLRIRAQRKPKLNRCCGEIDTSHQSVTNTTLCRSLRSREIDLSTSLKSNDSNKTLPKRTTNKNKKPVKYNKISKVLGDKTPPKSDVSFTFTTEVSPSDRTLRSRRPSAILKEQKPRQSDVSFTLLSEHKSINDTISTRSSKRNRELESLKNNSALFYKSGKVSPLCKKIAAETRAINKSSNMRLNRSRRLL